jgi:glycosyltransferase involved in cell wall biosynthesis
MTAPMTFDPPLDGPQAAAATADILAFSDRRARAFPSRRIALVGGFAPRKCGIATFTTDIFEQLAAHQPQLGVDVWALEESDGPAADARVAGRIAADCAESYRAAARAINEGGYDAVWLQHEYGIFGGEQGAMVLDFAERLAPPLIVTLHTVLSEPSDAQRAILERLIALASRVMVMSRRGRELLIERYAMDPERIAVIPHGAPERPFGRQAEFRARLGHADRTVLMTFGLLGPGKGIETMIAALPGIVARHPEAIYRIVGATHPRLVATQGEAYREKLEALAAELGVGDNVAFDNRFLETGELLDQLEACDIYVTPYPNLQQATSGTLSYAVALGKAVVSTPYVHARELLADGAGVLVEPGSAAALSEAVLALLDDRARLQAVQRAAYERGRQTIWPRFAAASAALVEDVAVRPLGELPPPTATPGAAAVLAMTDGTGMLQHGIGIVPDRRHGYCLDDNVRALLLMLRADGLPLGERQRLASTYASFVQHAWNEDRGHFRNFMNFDRSWCEEVGSEDSNGRTAWVLGELLAKPFDAGWRTWARPWFDRALASLSHVENPRAIAFGMLGAAAVLRAGIEHAGARAFIERGGAMLHRLLDAERRPDWAWFEAVLGYDNPRLPQALLEAGVALDRRDWRDAGIETLAWIAGQQRAPSGHFRPVGSETFGREYALLPFDQQPLEAWAAVEAAASAWRATGDARWLDHATVAHRWFFGGNDRGVTLGDLASGRCRDGVTPRGANENCGAESILAFQLACYAIAGLARAANPTDAGDRLGRSARIAGDTAANPR